MQSRAGPRGVRRPTQYFLLFQTTTLPQRAASDTKARRLRAVQFVGRTLYAGYDNARSTLTAAMPERDEKTRRHFATRRGAGDCEFADVPTLAAAEARH